MRRRRALGSSRSGTTATRAVETDAADGRAHAGEGWTELRHHARARPRGRRRASSAAGTSPRPATSSCMEAVAGRPLLEASYDAAVAGGYRWHEFGDIHLVLP